MVYHEVDFRRRSGARRERAAARNVRESWRQRFSASWCQKVTFKVRQVPRVVLSVGHRVLARVKPEIA